MSGYTFKSTTAGPYISEPNNKAVPLFRLPEIAFDKAHHYLNSDSVKGKLECKIPIIQHFDSENEFTLVTMIYVRDSEESEWRLVTPIGGYEGLLDA